MYEKKQASLMQTMLWAMLAIIALILGLDYLGIQPRDLITRPEPNQVVPVPAPVIITVLAPTQPAPALTYEQIRATADQQALDFSATVAAGAAEPPPGMATAQPAPAWAMATAVPLPTRSMVAWARPITKQQYDWCQIDKYINPACPGYGE